MIPFRRLPTFDSVAAGRKAVCTIDAGVRLHRIQLEIGNAAVAANALDDLVGDIVVKYRGKPQRIHTAGQLNHLNALNGSEYAVKSYGTDGQADRRHFLDIWFANPWRTRDTERLSPSWNLIDDGVQIEVNLVAGLAAPILTGTYQADAIPADQKEIGLIQKVYRNDYSAVGTSREIQTFDRLDLYEAIHFLPTVGGTSRFVEEVKLSRNSFDEQEAITYRENAVSLLSWGLNPDVVAVPWYELVLDYSDRLADGLLAQGAREFKAKVTWNDTANGVMPVITQRTGRPD